MRPVLHRDKAARRMLLRDHGQGNSCLDNNASSHAQGQHQARIKVRVSVPRGSMLNTERCFKRLEYADGDA